MQASNDIRKSKSLIIAATLFFSLPFVATSSDESPERKPATQIVKVLSVLEQAEETTKQLKALMKKYSKTNDQKKKEELGTEIIDKAKERKDIMVRLVKTNPSEMAKLSIMEKSQKGIPPELENTFEYKMKNESGKFEAVYEDSTGGLRQFLTTAEGKRFELHFKDKMRSTATGQNIKVSGLVFNLYSSEDTLDGSIVMDAKDFVILSAETSK